MCIRVCPRFVALQAKDMSSGVLRPLFVVSVDVKTCFDTINVSKLMRMVKVVIHMLAKAKFPSF